MLIRSENAVNENFNFNIAVSKMLTEKKKSVCQVFTGLFANMTNMTNINNKEF